MSKDVRRVKAQLRSASGRSSKILKDVDAIEVVIEVPGRGMLTLNVQSGGGYSLRAHPEPNGRGGEAAGDEAVGRDIVAVGVLGTEEVISVVPGQVP
jgi:hypothetical protein